MTKLRFYNCCGIIDLQRGVVLITIFALLNKISGFFGIPTIFDGGGTSSIISYIYSIIASIAITYFLLYGVFPENPKIIRYYSHFYWMDLFINVLFTSIFGIWWYLITDHLLLAETEKPKQNNELINNKEAVKVLETSTLPAWKAESAIAIIILISTALIHGYFALVIHSYANFVQKKKPYYPSSGIIPVPRVSSSGTSLLKPEDNSRRHLSVELKDEELPFNY